MSPIASAATIACSAVEIRPAQLPDHRCMSPSSRRTSYRSRGVAAGSVSRISSAVAQQVCRLLVGVDLPGRVGGRLRGACGPRGSRKVRRRPSAVPAPSPWRPGAPRSPWRRERGCGPGGCPARRRRCPGPVRGRRGTISGPVIRSSPASRAGSRASRTSSSSIDCARASVVRSNCRPIADAVASSRWPASGSRWTRRTRTS